MSDVIIEGAVCQPNFSAAGRRRRTQIAWAGTIGAVGLFAVLFWLDAWWPLRLLVGLPAAVAAFSALEVRRNTCVLHAAAGTFEGDDFRRKKVEADIAAASRRVAAGIWRDGAIAAALVALVSAATDFLM